MIKLFELEALFAQRVLDDLNSSLEACEEFAAILTSNPVLFFKASRDQWSKLMRRGEREQKVVAGRREKRRSN